MFKSDHFPVDLGTISNTFTSPVSAASHGLLMKSPGLPDYVRILEVPESCKLALTAAFQTAPNPDGRASLPRPFCCVSIGSLRRADQGFFDSPSPRFSGPR